MGEDPACVAEKLLNRSADQFPAPLPDVMAKAGFRLETSKSPTFPSSQLRLFPNHDILPPFALKHESTPIVRRLPAPLLPH
jgi:hypothetical protein